MKDYINARDQAKSKRNKIKIDFKKINEDNNETPIAPNAPNATNTRSPGVDIETVGEYVFDRLK